MRIGNRIFPYPVLNNIKTLSDYKDLSFNLFFDLDNNENIIEVKDNMIFKNIHIESDSTYIKDSINNKSLKCMCVIECSSTFFRKTYEIDFDYQDIIIKKDDLNKKVSISCYVYVNHNNFEYYSEEFSNDYIGYKFLLEKYDIVAIDDGFSFDVINYTNKLNKVSSIFTIAKKNDNSEIASYNLKRDKIIIYLPQDSYTQYYAMRNNQNSQSILFSIILIPCLCVCLETIKKEISNYEDINEIIENFLWFSSIMKRYNQINNRDLSIDAFKDIDTFELSQTLLDFSIKNSINDFYDFVYKNFDESDDEYE